MNFFYFSDILTLYGTEVIPVVSITDLSSSWWVETDRTGWCIGDVEPHFLHQVPLHKQILVGGIQRVVNTILHHKLAAVEKQKHEH